MTTRTPKTTSAKPRSTTSAKQAQPKENISKAFKEPDVAQIPKHYQAIKAKGVALMIDSSSVSGFDKERGEVVQYRYCEAEHSIYRDEQSDFSTVTPIVFKEGHLFVPPTKPNLAKFLDVHPGNEANGGRLFRLLDHQKLAKDKIEKEFEVVDAMILIRTKPVDDLLSVAVSLGLKTDRVLDEIKHDLTVYAKRNPKVFSEMFDDPSTKVKSDIKRAVSYGILSAEKGYVRWKDTNNHIIAVPEGKDAIDVMTRYCLTEAGSPVYEEIKRQLS